MRRPIRARECRYEYAGDKLNDWFEHVPIESPGHDTIWALATGSDGKIYIGLCAEGDLASAALATYDPRSGATRVVFDVGRHVGDVLPLGQIPHSKIHFAICPHGRQVWFATHVSRPRGPEDVHGPVGRGPLADALTGYEGGRVFCHDTRTGQTEDFGVVVAKEGIRCMKLSPDARYAYGISYPKHRFFMRDLLTGETWISPRVGKYGGIDLFIDRRGVPWGAHDGHEGTRAGQLYYFDASRRRLVDVDAFLPRSSRRQMSFPMYGNHVLHMTAGPDGSAVVSTYGESRIALFDPRRRLVHDWGSVWHDPPIQMLDANASPDTPDQKPHFAWAPQFGRSGGTVNGKKYDRILWYGEERWEYEENVRLSAIAYNHRRPDQIVKVRFGTPAVGGFFAGHWAASTTGKDGKIYFADRMRHSVVAGHAKSAGLRLAVFSPPRDCGPLRPAPRRAAGGKSNAPAAVQEFFRTLPLDVAIVMSNKSLRPRFGVDRVAKRGRIK